ncbi:MAG TPA: ATP-binding cassette domain-containing protein [Planosporangium sp.]|nr:ATP-binding cassette domain-containing protein [Planosporangium sp.]
MSDPPSPALLSAVGVVKRFGHVQALREAAFDAYPAEVVALIGDNGAGKSTLVKVLSGALRPDAGTMALNGQPLDLHSPLDAQRLGIETVYQDLALAFDLDAAANLHLGRETLRPAPLGWLGVLDKAAMRARAVEAFRGLRITLPDMTVPVRSLSGGQRQCVAVARAVAWATKVVFMDEPTAALGVVQRRQVLDVIRRIRDQGVAVVLISHNLPEVLAVADRVEVLRLGRRVARYAPADTSLEELVLAMTGGATTEDAT